MPLKAPSVLQWDSRFWLCSGASETAGGFTAFGQSHRVLPPHMRLQIMQGSVCHGFSGIRSFTSDRSGA